ncbi:Nucleoid occlusion factor SlmA [Georgfuchsia toluolica]|uniref:Nucleoid occlusion factor SlmA n=1 Tax=Georgfuchsia toluolica TaxID=424218 RepID=A0A916J466_9PROT|nr:nucleoid occlusion factor SlmA [Georgfuchsia toluolica]CAG4884272.1 Nucleoid occlusion factor SlmA [Georgfuchsia toluolica]
MAAKPGERKLQILQTIAAMLENPAGEKVTTALLAAKLVVSEAALYRHFASKAQMYEGLIEFIESGIFSVLNQIGVDEESGLRQVELMVATTLRFAQKNRGLTRVLIGDALVHENPRLQVRINQVTDRIEATLKQSLRIAVTQGRLPAEHDVGAHAAILVDYVIGRWHRFVKSGFKNDPMDQWTQHWLLLQR